MPSVNVDLETGEYTFNLADDVAQQLLEYALCEHASVKHVLENESQLTDDEKVVNFEKGAKIVDKNKKAHVVIQGARYSTLVGVYDHLNPTKYISFNSVLDQNGNYISEEDCIAQAEAYFFNQMEGETEEEMVTRQKA
jgi:hypothetical protein